MKAGMKIETRTVGDAAIVSPSGRLDGIGAPALEAALRDAARSGRGRVVVDCGGVGYIASAGIRALILGARACREAGGELALAALKPAPRAVVGATGLLSVMDCHGTVEAALAGTGRVRQPESGGPVRITERRGPRAAVLELAGRLDGIGAPVLGARIAAVTGRGAGRLVLDCRNLAYLNSAGLRALFLGARVCREAGVGLAVVPPADRCRAVLEMSGFLSVVECRETAGEAIRALDPPDDLPGDPLDDFPGN